MKTEYASAVAAVKAMESTLMTQNDIEQLINTSTKSERQAFIDSRNGDVKNISDVWDMLMTFASDSKELKILLYRNDFHNLKAVLKAMISNRDPEIYYVSPSNVTLEELKKAFRDKEADILPEHMRDTARSAYELLTRTLDGQLSDSLIDCAALEAMQKSAADCGSEFMKRYAALISACADIKTAYRCSKMGKSRQFLESAVCGSSELDKEALIRSALSGVEALYDYLKKSGYEEAAELLKENPAGFEKWCDDVIMELAADARMQAFGVEPLAAYYIAKEAELKNIRIINVCKESGTAREIITERMRKLYV